MSSIELLRFEITGRDCTFRVYICRDLTLYQTFWQDCDEEDILNR